MGAKLERLPYLYYYMSLADQKRGYAEELVLQDKMYFKPYDRLNDPFEARIAFTYDASDEIRTAYWRDFLEETSPGYSEDTLNRALEGSRQPDALDRMSAELIKEIETRGVYCLTECINNLLLWAHYADGHRGVCFRFRTDGLFRDFGNHKVGMLIQMGYQKRYPTVSFYRDGLFKKARAVLATKSSDWRYEREWRLLYNAGPGHAPISPVILDAVIAGCRVSGTDLAFLREIVAKRTHRLDLLRASRNEGVFGVTIAPDH
jgi:hypothetical protein